MHYTVKVQGEPVEVEIRDGSGGVEVSVAGGPFQPARLQPSRGPLHSLELGSRRHSLLLAADPLDPDGLTISLAGGFPLRVRAQDARTLSASRGRQTARAAGPRLQRSAMPGIIVEVRVTPGTEVVVGDILLVLEAMKMQNEIRSEAEGVVRAVHVQAGDTVPAGAELVEIGPHGA